MFDIEHNHPFFIHAQCPRGTPLHTLHSKASGKVAACDRQPGSTAAFKVHKPDQAALRQHVSHRVTLQKLPDLGIQRDVELVELVGLVGLVGP